MPASASESTLPEGSTSQRSQLGGEWEWEAGFDREWALSARALGADGELGEVFERQGDFPGSFDEVYASSSAELPQQAKSHMLGGFDSQANSLLTELENGCMPPTAFGSLDPELYATSSADLAENAISGEFGGLDSNSNSFFLPGHDQWDETSPIMGLTAWDPSADENSFDGFKSSNQYQSKQGGYSLFPPTEEASTSWLLECFAGPSTLNTPTVSNVQHTEEGLGLSPLNDSTFLPSFPSHHRIPPPAPSTKAHFSSSRAKRASRKPAPYSVRTFQLSMEKASMGEIPGEKVLLHGYTFLKFVNEEGETRYRCVDQRCECAGTDTIGRAKDASRHVETYMGEAKACALREESGCDYTNRRLDKVWEHERKVHMWHRQGCQCGPCCQK